MTFLRAFLHACCAGLLLAAGGAHAERADRDKPINVEADRLEYDDLNRVNVFTGNVTLTKGTLVIRGDRMVLRQDAEGYQYGDTYGKPATFRQRRDPLPDTPEQWIEGEAQRLEYDGRQDQLRLHQRSQLRRTEGGRVTDELFGTLITYDSRTEAVTVNGGTQPTPTAGNPSGRVRVVIQPRQPTEAAPAPALAAPLRQAPALPQRDGR